jgi:tryptophan synthase alpha chain
MADGPVIQRASERALARGVGLARVLAMAASFRRRDRDTPLVLMGYLNPIECFGAARFAREAAAAGVDGVLLVDSPPEEDGELVSALAQAGVARILLVAPTTSEARLAAMAPRARGFVYYVSFAGVTGADRLANERVLERLGVLRRHVQVPIAVGFGVKDAQQAAALSAAADAVVIGSALVDTLAEAPSAADAAARARTFLAPIRAALDRARAPVAA